MKKQITVIGSLNYDMILKVKRLPYEGETMAAEGVSMAAGGKGSNQAAQAAKLGIPTYLIGAVGNDSMGEFLIAEAKKYGIITDRIKVVEGSSGLGIVNALEDGSVHATIVRGANYQLTKEDIDKNMDLLESSGVIILQNEILPETNKYVMEIARDLDCKVILNAAPAEELDQEHLAMCDIVVVNEVEASFYCGREIKDMNSAMDAITISRELGNTWVFTLGSQGSLVASGERCEFIPSHHVKAIETTGAGDSYIGALGYALCEGMDAFDGGRFSTCCSAITVCGIGAQQSMPTLEQVKVFRASL
ncbi:MAG: ribokinase [Lachnospiraceae bacterium]|nr:ribokinase [Lachnospiraceae bacterium]